ncbi:MAG: hypothetical protein NTV23_02875 [Propionibacteriales bacterium]|nr:hypothetical protein [Propionibacteriales bacterium]
MRRSFLGLTCAVLVAVGLSTTGPSSARSELVVAGTTCPTFPASNWWHADVSRLPIHPRSAAWKSHMSSNRALHPDFGPSYGDGPDYGIPITVVDSTHPKVAVRFQYASESDRTGYPLGADTRIEGGRNSSGDKHAIVIDTGTCRLYETWNTRQVGSTWYAGSGATWSLKSNALRPNGWTSADAAGLPILPGLLRWNEVAAGRIDHAIRFTTDVTANRHLWPARHHAGSTSSLDYPPMGARFRLRAGYDASRLGAQARVVVAAMKKYGLVLADNGSPWYFQGEQNAAWPERLIDDLKRIPASQFVAVNTSSLVPR